MSHPDTLSIHRSFVLRLHQGVDVEAGNISGRVEHIVSGEIMEFCSIHELLSSIRLMMRAGDKVMEE